MKKFIYGGIAKKVLECPIFKVAAKICLFLHPTIEHHGEDQDTLNTESTGSKSIAHWPQYCTDVHHMAGSIKGAGALAGQIVSPKQYGYEEHQKNNYNI